jgi:UDP-glucose 4-epimerase
MSRVAIIGGSGFLGRALCRELLRHHHDVISISRDLPHPLQPGIEYIDCGYDQFSALGDIYQRCDAIVHLAWDTTPALSLGTPSVEVSANLLPLARFLEALTPQFAGQLLFVSSGGAVYGDGAVFAEAGHQALDETAALQPVSYYGAAKGAAELFLDAFQHQSGTPITVLRPSNIYGPGQTIKRFFAVVPTLFEAIREQQVFRVIGDGSAARDYLFIDDFSQLVARIVAGPGASGRVQRLNACAGQSVTLKELIHTAEDVSGLQARLEFVPTRDSDVSAVRLSPAAAEAAYGWRAETTLREGLAKTWQWMERRSTS